MGLDHQGIGQQGQQAAKVAGRVEKVRVPPVCPRVRANHAWSIGALAETANSGRPNETANSIQSQGAGNVVACGSQPSAT